MHRKGVCLPFIHFSPINTQVVCRKPAKFSKCAVFLFSLIQKIQPDYFVCVAWIIVGILSSSDELCNNSVHVNEDMPEFYSEKRDN